MKLVSLKCPECGATLKDLDMDRKECFCSYCGAKIVLDEEIIKQDIKIEKRIIDEAAIEHEKTARNDNLMAIMPLVLMIIAYLIWVLTH